MGQQHNELRRASELSDAVKIIVGESDSDSTVERFGETLTPVLDIWRLPEWSFLRRELRFTTVDQLVAAVPAQFSFLQLLNPGPSTRLLVVQGGFFRKTAGGSGNLALTTTVRGASFQGPVPIDTRWEPVITPAAALAFRDPASFSGGNTAAFGSDVLLDILNIPAASTRIDWPDIVLAPGTGVVVSDATLNEALGGTFFGYSRQVRTGEI